MNLATWINANPDAARAHFQNQGYRSAKVITDESDDTAKIKIVKNVTTMGTIEIRENGGDHDVTMPKGLGAVSINKAVIAMLEEAGL